MQVKSRWMFAVKYIYDEWYAKKARNKYNSVWVEVLTFDTLT